LYKQFQQLSRSIASPSDPSIICGHGIDQLFAQISITPEASQAVCCLSIG
jgi:hypothetical protein